MPKFIIELNEFHIPAAAVYLFFMANMFYVPTKLPFQFWHQPLSPQRVPLDGDTRAPPVLLGAQQQPADGR